MESFENNKPVDRHIEGAIRDNEEFLGELASAQSVEEVERVVEDFTRIQDGEEIIFEIIEGQQGEDDAYTYSVEEIKNALRILSSETDVDAAFVEETVKHKDIAAALKRIWNLA